MLATNNKALAHWYIKKHMGFVSGHRGKAYGLLPSTSALECGSWLPMIISNLTPDLILWPVYRVNQHPPAHYEGCMDGTRNIFSVEFQVH
jgi:hypothetical protein